MNNTEKSIKKHKFSYIAKSYSDGSEQRGTIEAEDRNAAIAAIRANGLMPTAVGQIIDEPIVYKRPIRKIEYSGIKKILKKIAKTIDNFVDNI